MGGWVAPVCLPPCSTAANRCPGDAPPSHSPSVPSRLPHTQVVSYKGCAEAREEVWTRQLRCGRGKGAGAGTHVVLTTYDYLMGKNDK